MTMAYNSIESVMACKRICLLVIQYAVESATYRWDGLGCDDDDV